MASTKWLLKVQITFKSTPDVSTLKAQKFFQTQNENRTFSDSLTNRVDLVFKENVGLSFVVIYCRRNKNSAVQEQHTTKKNIANWYKFQDNVDTYICVCCKVLWRTDGTEKSSTYVNRAPDTNNNKNMRPIRVLRRLNIFPSYILEADNWI